MFVRKNKISLPATCSPLDLLPASQKNIDRERLGVDYVVALPSLAKYNLVPDIVLILVRAYFYVLL